MNKSIVSASFHLHLTLLSVFDADVCYQTQHVLHHGRAEYTLITPGGAGKPPKIDKVVMGTDVAAGEQRQLLVGTGVWKRSTIPDKDIASAKSSQDKQHTGCLITEVVIPGFHWEDHAFLTKQGLEDLFKNVEGGDAKIKEYENFVKKST
jgi:predicted cupin superfamily sugar epimerase